MLPPRFAVRQGSAPNLLPNGLQPNALPTPDYPVSRYNDMLPAKEPILGFTLDGKQIAAVMSELPRFAHTGTVAGATVRFIPYLGGYRVEAVTDHAGWCPIKTKLCFWFAWALAHSDTVVYHPEVVAASGPRCAAEDDSVSE